MAAAVSVSAFAENKTFDVKDYPDFHDAEEFSEVIEQAREDKSTFDAFVSDTPAVVAFNGDARSTGEFEAYKTHIVGMPFFLNDLKDGILFGNEISEEYVWYITNNNVTVMIKKDNGKWQVYGSSEMLPDDDDVYQSNEPRFGMINDAVEKIRESDTSEIKDIVCVSDVAGTYTSYVCVFTDNTYVVPFSARPDFTGLEYGKVYTPDEAEGILRENGYFDPPQYDENGNPLIGGVGGVVKSAEAPKEGVEVKGVEGQASFPTLMILVIPAALIVLGISIMLVVWNKGAKRLK